MAQIKAWFSIKDFAEALGLSEVWVRRMVHQKKLAAKKDAVDKWWIPASEVTRYRAEQEAREATYEARKAGTKAASQEYLPPKMKAAALIEQELTRTDWGLSSEDLARFTEVLHSIYTIEQRRWEARKAGTLYAEPMWDEA